MPDPLPAIEVRLTEEPSTLTFVCRKCGELHSSMVLENGLTVEEGRTLCALVRRYRAELKELRKNPIGCCFAGVGQPCPNHEK